MADAQPARKRRDRPAPAPPPELEEIVACLGPEMALRLVEQRGGTRVHVPFLDQLKRSFLLELVGEEPLRRLSHLMGGATLRVPLCKSWRTRVYLNAGGRSHAEIARLVGCTEKWVQAQSHADWTPMPRSHKGVRATPASDHRQMTMLPTGE